MADIGTLVKPLSAAQMQEAIYTAIAAQGISTTSWKEGAAVRTVISALAIVLSAFSLLTSLLAKSGFLEFAFGDWLDLVGVHVYGTERIGETFATGEVVLTNETGVGSFVNVQPGDLVVKNGEGKTYTNTEVFTLPAVLDAEVTVSVQATEAGSASTTGDNTITEFVTAFVGCSVTNPAGLLGTDRELDPQYKARARAKTGTLSPNGPKDAYYYLATSAKKADGSSVGVTRVRSIPDGVGGVDVYVADADGPVAAPELAIIDEEIQTKAAPLAITATIHSATAQSIDVTYEAWVQSSVGYSEAALEVALEEEALLSYVGSVPIGGERLPLIVGGFVYVSGLAGCIADFVGREHLIRLNVTSPAADVAIGDTAAPQLGTVTATIHLVPNTEGA